MLRYVRSIWSFWMWFDELEKVLYRSTVILKRRSFGIHLCVLHVMICGHLEAGNCRQNSNHRSIDMVNLTQFILI